MSTIAPADVPLMWPDVGDWSIFDDTDDFPFEEPPWVEETIAGNAVRE